MPADLPPSPPAVSRALDQEQQRAPLQIPGSDVFVEVIGELPLQTRIQYLTRLLSRRQLAVGGQRTYRAYPPTILELIMLVEPNPTRPSGHTWLAINFLTLGYDARTEEVIVEYCLEHCELDSNTRAHHPQRRMASYRAAEALVVKRINKKLGKLQKFAERPDLRRQ